MTRLLPSSRPEEPPQTALSIADTREGNQSDEDLKRIFGTEFWRVEYLLHLIHTGRVKDEG